MQQYIAACKAYDVRGVYKEQIDEVLMYMIGVRLGAQMLLEQGQHASCLIGADTRAANNTLVYWFIKWLEHAWVDQIVLGGKQVTPGEGELRWWVMSTSILYHLADHIQSYGVQFTASHNPPQYAWCKILTPAWVLMDTQRIRTWLEDGEMYISEKQQQDILSYIPTLDERAHMREQYSLERMCTQWQDAWSKHPLVWAVEQMYTWMHTIYATCTRSVTIVIDCSQGAGVSYEKEMLTEIAQQGGHKIIWLHDQADGRSTAHGSDTTDAKNYADLIDAVQTHQADLGIMFDGDADRIGLVDNRWTIIGGDLLVAWMAHHILAEYDHFTQQAPTATTKTVVYDIWSTRTIADVIQRHHAQGVVSRIGQKFLKEKFAQHNAIFAGELSGHLFFAETKSHEMVLYAIYVILYGMTQDVRPLAEQFAELMTYYKSPLHNFHVTDAQQAVALVQEHFASDTAATIDMTDGVRVNYPDKWILVRPSNTEPVVRVCAEATTRQACDALLEHVKDILQVA